MLPTVGIAEPETQGAGERKKDAGRHSMTLFVFFSSRVAVCVLGVRSVAFPGFPTGNEGRRLANSYRAERG